MGMATEAELSAQVLLSSSSDGSLCAKPITICGFVVRESQSSKKAQKVFGACRN